MKKRRLFRRIKRFCQTLRLTGSVRAACAVSARRSRIATVRIPGYPSDLCIRAGTSDAEMYFELLRSGFELSEYQIPLDVEPRTILDIGANIGTTSLALARRYPRSRVYAFEPLPENFELLQHNVHGMPNIIAVPCALGSERTSMEYYPSADAANLGGGTFFPRPEQLGLESVRLQVETVGAVLMDLGIKDVDLIKIDTEGAEYDIVTSLPRDVLAGVAVVVGELHDVRDRELCDYLKQWFSVRLRPASGRQTFFTAVNKADTRWAVHVGPMAGPRGLKSLGE